VLGRNIIKHAERRKGLPFARFRAKLVALLLVMTLVPAILVLIGQRARCTNIDRWFNAPMAEISRRPTRLRATTTISGRSWSAITPAHRARWHRWTGKRRRPAS
jgi:nitrogen fixation/metabolism regulation signal transduction histidine kinase